MKAMISQEEYFSLTEKNAIHPIFSLLEKNHTKPSDANDSFYEGLAEGYDTYYDTLRYHPEPLSPQSFVQFLRDVREQRYADVNYSRNTFLTYWEYGFIAGWCVGLSENNPNLFYEGDQRLYGSASDWISLRVELEVDITCREEHAEHHKVQYGLIDKNGIYIVTVDRSGIACTCSQPECNHRKLISHISTWFGDMEVVIGEEVFSQGVVPTA